MLRFYAELWQIREAFQQFGETVPDELSTLLRAVELVYRCGSRKESGEPGEKQPTGSPQSPAERFNAIGEPVRIRQAKALKSKMGSPLPEAERRNRKGTAGNPKSSGRSESC